ncbi:hypothetical protein [Cohnella thailandensis]|jgi:hypothetical protein|uniref:DUF2269 family protein n=1 Tax=Cohnella thailandensis TaxID=557557 RepID=A0A841SUD7_9BACL|nr:hypothetical protein [Cohnella thailandensis]MBB6635933.1 hypothetical protein [Cohnella thailandensis]MBP1976311.1 putative membrane protein [Cohnella thailandensis]
MNTVMLFLHVVGAVGMGIYAILPFLVGKFKQLSTPAQEGLASGLLGAGRIGQFSLVLQLLTGGYLISKADYTVAWMVVVIVIFVAIGAMAGMVQGPLKRIRAAAAGNQDASANVSKVQTFSAIAFVLFLVIIWLMQDPWYA